MKKLPFLPEFVREWLGIIVTLSPPTKSLKWHDRILILFVLYLSVPIILLILSFIGLYNLIVFIFEIMMKRRIMMKKILKRSLALVVLVGLVLLLGLISVAGFSWFSSWLNPSKPLNQLETDLNGYIVVEQGTKVIFPLWSWNSDRSLFPVKNYFEIVSVLGNPQQHSFPSEPQPPLSILNVKPRLTNFDENDLWFLVRDCSSYEPRFFIIRIQEDKDNFYREVVQSKFQNKRSTSRTSSRTALAALFSAREFFDQSGKAIIKPTGYYLLVRKSGEKSKEIVLTVNKLDSESALNAQIFASKTKGKLVIVIDEKRRYLCLEDRPLDLYRDVSHLTIEQVPIDEIKSRPELEAGLPNPLNLLPQKYLIDWSQINKDDSVTREGGKGNEQKK